MILSKQIVHVFDSQSVPDSSQQISRFLLGTKCVKLQPTDPFTWASGLKSLIYCDNRKSLSHPKMRTYIKNTFVALIREQFPETEVIAGVATGAIAIGALVADVLGLPFIYVRPKPKGHGLENLIEGDLDVYTSKKVFIIEDLTSTGKSSLVAFNALKDLCTVLGMGAIFSYMFPVVAEKFQEAGCPLWLLTNYPRLIIEAEGMGVVTKDQLELLRTWSKDPKAWSENYLINNS